MSRHLVRILVALLIAVVLVAAYSIVAKNQTSSASRDAPAGFLH